MQLKSIKSVQVFSDSFLTKRIIYKDANQLVFTLNFKPGQTLPIHTHEQSSLSIYVVEGTAKVKVNKQVTDVKTGDVLTLLGKEALSIPEVSTALTLFVVISPLPKDPDFAEEV